MTHRDRVPLLIYVTQDIKTEIEKRAAAQERSVSYVGWKLLEKVLKA